MKQFFNWNNAQSHRCLNMCMKGSFNCGMNKYNHLPSIYIKHGAVDNLLSHWSASKGERCCYTWDRRSFGHPPLVGPQLVVLQALSGVVANITAADSTGVLAVFFRTSRPTPGTINLVFFTLTQSPVRSTPALHWTWWYTPPGCARWAPGHQHREAPKAHQWTPGWRALG